MAGDPSFYPAEDLEIRLRDFLDDDDAVSAVQVMLAAGWIPPSDSVRRVVERYGRVWAKDTDYYDAAKALGIKEPPS